MIGRFHRYLQISGLLAVLVWLGSCAKPLAPPFPQQTKDWATRTLAGMSLEQKVGQMILARTDRLFLNAGAPELVTLSEEARAGRIGGVVFFKGDPLDTATIANRLQDQAPLPLLVGIGSQSRSGKQSGIGLGYSFRGQFGGTFLFGIVFRRHRIHRYVNLDRPGARPLRDPSYQPRSPQSRKSPDL